MSILVALGGYFNKSNFHNAHYQTLVMGNNPFPAKPPFLAQWPFHTAQKGTLSSVRARPRNLLKIWFSEFAAHHITGYQGTKSRGILSALRAGSGPAVSNSAS
jgi:hypothetical protein